MLLDMGFWIMIIRHQFSVEIQLKQEQSYLHGAPVQNVPCTPNKKSELINN